MGNEQSKQVLNDYLDLDPKPPTPRQTWTVDKSNNNESRIAMERPQPSPNQDDTDTDTDTSSRSLLSKCDTAEMTGSFLHLHIALDATGLDLDSMEAHYTVMARGLSGDIDVSANANANTNDGPCGELNMIAVSNPCVIDRTLAPEGYIVVHAYGAGNEPYDIWANLSRTSAEYKALKEQRASVLWEAVESIIPDARERVVMNTDLVGTPLTHERFLRRPRGTYGAATEDYLRDGKTPIAGLVLCGDGIFPGIGVPAVAYSGASAANAMVNPFEHWKCMDQLKSEGLI